MDVDLETYAALSARDLHSGYLNRLYTSRDCEAGLVKIMRDKFEVTSLLLLSLITATVLILLAPKGRFVTFFKPGLEYSPQYFEIHQCSPQGTVQLSIVKPGLQKILTSEHN